MRIVFAPPHQQSWSPPPSIPPLSGDGNPYKQGESAIRITLRMVFLTPSLLITHSSLLPRRRAQVACHWAMDFIPFREYPPMAFHPARTTLSSLLTTH